MGCGNAWMNVSEPAPDAPAAARRESVRIGVDIEKTVTDLVPGITCEG